MFNDKIFNISNALGSNPTLINRPIVNLYNSNYSNVLESMIEDTEVIANNSTDFYKNIDSNKDIISVSEEYYKFYNKTSQKIIEMCDSMINNAKDHTNNVNSIIERSYNNIQRYLDHINNKPDDYEYRAISFRYSFNNNVPILSDIVEIGKEINIDDNTDIVDKFNTHKTRISNSKFMDIVRGSIAGMYGAEIEADAFHDTIYRLYRNGDDEAQSITFSKRNLLEICNTILSYLDASQSIMSNAERIKTEVLSVLEVINNLIRSEYVNDFIEEHVYIYYTYLYNKIIELIEVFMMVRLAFNIKLEAYSESYLSRLDIIRTHYDTGGVSIPSNDDYLLESINNIFFIANMEENRINMTRCVNEAYSLSLNEVSHVTTNLRIVNEDYISNKKAALGRLMTRIKNLWDKFKERVISLTRSDKVYLSKYKNIILDRPMANNTFEMYDFPNGLKIMQQATIPRFNYAALKDSLITEDDFINSYFSRYKKNDMSFTDSCKSIFRGSPAKKSFNSSNLDIKSMYNFCINYNKMIDSIKNDMNNIEAAGNEAIKIIDAIDVNTESVVYSSLRRSVIYEDDTNSNITIEDNRKRDTRNADAKSRASNDDSKSDDISKVMNYMKVTQNFLGCKMTVLQEIYKGYMFIIKEHVKSHTGVRDVSKPQNKNEINMKNIEDEKDITKVKTNFLSK